MTETKAMTVHPEEGNPLLAAALEYAARGWAVLPLHSIRDGRCTCGQADCKHPGKHPHTAHGHKDATTDGEQIGEWWRVWPDANVGIATGAESGLTVLDVDPRHGGDPSFGDLVAEHDPMPDTVESLTGGGGRHIFFKHPRGRVKTKPNALGPGLDVKGDGGYIVAPPSLHESGRRYEWELSGDPKDVALAECPAWLVDGLGTSGPRVAEAQPGLAGDRIKEGERNATLASLAGSMRRRGMSEGAILAALREENRLRCEPPLAADEVERIASSLGRYPPAVEAAGGGGGYQPFPLDALPEPVRSYVDEGAEAIGCDVSYVALPLLAVLAAAIGNARRIVLKNEWSEPSVLWTAIVGDSGTLKSPAVDLALKPLRQEQEEAMRDGDERFICSDITVEAVAVLLEKNPRGLLLVRDELAGWVSSFDAYKGKHRAGDAAHWLEMHRAGLLLVDRKAGDKKTTCVPRAAVSVTGGIQPDMLVRVLDQEHFEDGLAARLLLSMPPGRTRRWTEEDISADTVGQVREVVRRLLSLKGDEDGNGATVPVHVPLTPQAREVWVAFFNAHGEEMRQLAGRDLIAVWSKLEGYVARLALVLHCVREASRDSTLETSDAVDQRSMESAIALARWFGHEARRVYARMQETRAEREQRELVAYIQRHGGRVSPRDLMRGGPCCKTTAEARMTLEALARAGWGEWDPAAGKGSRQVFRLFATTDTDTHACGSGNLSVSVAEDGTVPLPLSENPCDGEEKKEGLLDYGVSMGYNGGVMERLSDQVRRAIDESGLSRYRICKLVGLSEAQMSRFMNHKGSLSMDTLDRVAEVLHLRIVTDDSSGKQKGG